MVTLLKIPAEMAVRLRGRWDSQARLEPIEYVDLGWVLNAKILYDPRFKEAWPLLDGCETVTLTASQVRALTLVISPEEP